jgi:hypothetical protein
MSSTSGGFNYYGKTIKCRDSQLAATLLDFLGPLTKINKKCRKLAISYTLRDAQNRLGYTLKPILAINHELL